MMTRRLVLLVLVLTACARDDARAPTTATTPPPSTNAATSSDAPTPSPTVPVADPETTPTLEPIPPAPADVVTIIEVDIQAGPLGSQLAAVAARAKTEGRTAVVELWAGWCAPCKKLDKLIDAGTVTDALRGTILVRVDVDMFDDELTDLGFTAPQIPSFYRIDGRGKPKGKPLSGADWTKRGEGQIAAALREFVGT